MTLSSTAKTGVVRLWNVFDDRNSLRAGKTHWLKT